MFNKILVCSDGSKYARNAAFIGASIAGHCDSEVLALLVFFQRLEINRNNGRKRGRAFIDFIRGRFHGARLVTQRLPTTLGRTIDPRRRLVPPATQVVAQAVAA